MKKKTILVVEDEDNLRETTVSMIRDYGIILQARTGIEAIDIISCHNIDLILTDINMPKMDGMELICEIRKAGLSTPIILVSGSIDSEVRIQANKLGVEYFLEKPFLLSDLNFAIKSLL